MQRNERLAPKQTTASPFTSTQRRAVRHSLLDWVMDVMWDFPHPRWISGGWTVEQRAWLREAFTSVLAELSVDSSTEV